MPFLSLSSFQPGFTYVHGVLLLFCTGSYDVTQDVVNHAILQPQHPQFWMADVDQCAWLFSRF